MVKEGWLWEVVKTNPEHNESRFIFLFSGSDRLFGDLLSLLSASLTGVSQVLACYSIQDFHPSEYLGMLGLWGTLLSAGQT